MRNQKLICCIWSLLVLALCLSICQTSLADVLRIPEGTKVIEEEAFYGDTSLDEVVLPDGIQEIGPRAFAGSSVKSINLPASITKIADEASSFEECSDALVARVYENSYAHQWCIDHNISCVIISGGATSSFSADITDIVTKYTNNNGYILPENKQAAIQEVSTYLAAAHKAGTIKEYEADSNGVVFLDNQKSEVWVWQPWIEGTSSGGTDGTVEIFSIDTFTKHWGLYAPRMSKIGSTIDEALSSYSLKKEAKTQNVTYKTFTEIGDNQVVLLETHGGVLTNGINLLATGTLYDDLPAGQFKTSIPSLKDLTSEEYGVDFVHTVIPQEKGKDYVVVTLNYLRRSIKSTKGTFFFLNTCHSGEGNLWSTLKNKGASGMVCFDGEINTQYAWKLIENIIDRMLLDEPEMVKHYTVGEAFEYAVIHATEKPGDNAAPKIYGNQGYTFYPATFRGVVYDKSANNVPLAGALVYVKRSIEIPGLPNETTTNENGEFELLLPSGEYEIIVSKEYGYKKEKDTLNFEEGQILEKDYSLDKGVLTGIVTDETTGKPIEGAIVTLEEQSSITDEAGRYKLERPDNAGSDVFTVIFSEENHKTEIVEITMPSHDTVVHDQKLLSTIPGIVNGYVVENMESGSAIEGATITITDSNGEEVIIDKPNSWTTTNSDGLYMFDIEPGTYTLTASKEGYENETSTMTVSPRETIRQDFALLPSEHFTITFNANGGTVSNETITVVKGDPIGELPTASNGDKRLKEWNTEPDGNGVAITSAYIPDDDMTVYAIWNERGTAYEGRVFQCLSNNYVQGVTVELHRGAKQVEYYNERIAGGSASGETEITERELAPYESEIIDSCVTDSNGHYTLYLPFDGEPNYTSYNVSFYAYTLVFRKDGWITKYASSAFRNEDEVASRSPYIYALAPEGEGIRYEVTIPSVGTQSSIIHPYSSYEFSYLGNMYSATYDVSRVSLYMNGAYRVGYSAPRYVSETNWRLGFYSDGYFYLVNKTYKDTYPSGSYLYPSWANK